MFIKVFHLHTVSGWNERGRCPEYLGVIYLFIRLKSSFILLPPEVRLGLRSTLGKVIVLLRYSSFSVPGGGRSGDGVGRSWRKRGNRARVVRG